MQENTIFTDNMRDFEKNMHDFIGIEVQTGITFAETALEMPEHKQEDTAKARKGYDTALKFIAEAQQRFPDHPLSSDSAEGLAKLKHLLEQLGERL